MNQRYVILDGLRGVAAIGVLVYHLFEAIAFSAGAAEQHFYNGFLAVDFFFILSGFVMGYAYDARLADGRLTTGGFILRRLIRLHPMVIMGAIMGLAGFALQGFTNWEGERMGASMVLTAFVFALFLLPTPLRFDVRGNTEAFPLNGPHWSLFFEYIGSLLYVVALRKFPTRLLKLWTLLMGILLLTNALLGDYNSIAYGWSAEPYNLFGGLLRLLFAYPLGLLLSRLFQQRKPAPTRLPAFTLSALALLGLMSVPSLTTLTGIQPLNPVYQCLTVGVAFPLIIWFGARGTLTGGRQQAVDFLGRLSYPLYSVHYPLIYLYIYWLHTGQHPFGTWPWATPIALFCIAIVLSSIILLAYDEPLRRWLGGFMRR